MRRVHFWFTSEEYIVARKRIGITVNEQTVLLLTHSLNILYSAKSQGGKARTPLPHVHVCGICFYALGFDSYYENTIRQTFNLANSYLNAKESFEQIYTWCVVIAVAAIANSNTVVRIFSFLSMKFFCYIFLCDICWFWYNINFNICAYVCANNLKCDMVELSIMLSQNCPEMM